MKQDTKKVFIKNFGCQMNIRDSEVICGLLRTMDYELTTNRDNADVAIFNTCSVRQHAEERVWSEIGRLAVSAKRSAGRRPVIGIVGCMAQNYKDGIFRRAPVVDFVVGPSDIDKIPGIIDRFFQRNLYEKKIWEADGNIRPEELYHTGFYEDKEHAYVVISEGCSNFCSYCIVPYVRGPLRNRAHKDILREIRDAVDKGITKFTLLGQNVNAYEDGEVAFIELVKLIESVGGLKEFSFLTSHPKDTSDGLFKAMAECGKLKKCLHLPVQSGSDRILKLMNRGYTRKSYLGLADDYRKIVKGGVLTTDIIVGFPTESEEDFRDTHDLIKEVEFNAAFIFKYSPRPHTSALNMPDDVAKEEKERRHAMALELQKKISGKKK